ncbi:hydrophobic/amphiphilic exporter-1, HAE1 family [Aquiflexum balticum DSM 16537]|uniref:Hydrophobic/amphiphilic exporter-1, HAE1 family n=1 Tax=Aquiflexum balticum DSM 16537 TaxID=758820 RepID=A0A1W2HB78_9BACT|nr:efflux RND transporter permease subunit [Aquiflexum balticum]SMD45856.1 hydrophobic/amphiphilic exporter-1, HAE1 family [Aquiflexum balticum DSM 16537]
MQEQHHFFVRRPIVAIVIAIVTVTIGLVALGGLPIEQYPNITPSVVRVSTNYTGASAVSVEQSVATPLEQKINGVENMIYMKSTNANDGSMSIQVTFDIGTDPDMNTVFTQNRVASAMAKLPQEVTRMGVTTEKSMSNILLLLSLVSPDGRYDQKFLGNYSMINIRDNLARIPGVGRVTVIGSSDYSMRIWVKPDILAKMGITIAEITEAIRAQSTIVPGGKLGAEPAPPGTDFTYVIRLPERLQSEEEFNEIIVRTHPDGSQVRIKDIARVELGTESYGAFTTTDQAQSALISIYQSPGSNAVKVAEDVMKEMENLAQSYPEGIEHSITLDSTKPISAGIAEIVETLVIALLLVIFVVYIFIQDWRATLIPTLAIPVSLVGAFMLFPLLGFSINVLSLLGLVLAIGIVVDDAIVVVEAVQVKMDGGMGAKQATTEAMKEVTAPIIATSLVLIAVFVPVVAIPGITGRLYQQFAITIAVSVFISSINALSLSPALCSLLLKPKKEGERKGLLGRFFNSFDKAFEKSTQSYMGVTRVVGGKLKRGVVFILLTVVAAGILGYTLPGGFIPEEDQGYIFVSMQLPNAASLQRSREVAQKVEKIIAGIPEVETFATAVGYNLLADAMSTNSVFMFVSLKDWEERGGMTAIKVSQKINGILATQVKDAFAFSFGPPAIPGLGSGSGFSIMIQDQLGEDPKYLFNNTMAFIQAANQRPEIGRASTQYQASVPQRFIEFDNDKILKTGVRLQDVYSTFGAFTGGAYVNDFTKFGRIYRAYIQAESEYRQNEKGLDLFFVKNKDGESVPISTFAEVKDVSGPEYTTRFNLYRSAEVTGVPAPGYSSIEALNALEEVAAEVLPSNMSYSWNGMSYQEKKSSGSAGVIFAFSFFLVFLILAAQYESWSLPLSIMLGTPFAILGAFLFLVVARYFSISFENNIFAQISLILLIAMAAKNAILIVEFAKLKFDEGLSLYDAAMDAAKLRFRPILMTVFSFVLGILPLVLASGSGAEARKVMGMALLGGIGIATFLGVFMYPMLFVLIGKLFGYEKKRDLEKLKSNPSSS